MDLFRQWYDNGIYYPNIFLFTIGAVALAVSAGVAIFTARLFPIAAQKIISYVKKPRRLLQNYRRRQIIIDRMRSAYRLGSLWLMNNQLWVLVLLLLVTILTRFSVSYSGKIVAAPETIFQLSPVGRDLYVGVYEPALALVGKNGFLSPMAAVGPGLLLIVGPLIHKYLFFKGFCVYVQLGCHFFFYQRFLIASLVGWLLFIIFIMRGALKESRYVMLVYFTLFLLGIPGSVAIERGNIDLLLSLIVGFLLFVLLQVSKKQFPAGSYRLISILIGFLGGLLVNAKLFLLPFALVSLFIAPFPILAVAVSVLTFFSFTSYLPNALYGIGVTLSDLWLTNIVSAKEGIKLFFVPERLSLSHSLDATASLFTNCTQGYCSNSDVTFISVFSKILFFVFIAIPIGISIITVIKKYRGRFNLKIANLYYFVKDKNSILFFFIIADAFINLFFQITFLYRLFYSLPILLLVYKETAPNSKARWYCYLSMIFLAIKGLWINYTVLSKGFSPLDARAMNTFVVLHYYYLVKAGLAGIEEKFSRLPSGIQRNV